MWYFCFWVLIEEKNSSGKKGEIFAILRCKLRKIILFMATEKNTHLFIPPIYFSYSFGAVSWETNIQMFPPPSTFIHWLRIIFGLELSEVDKCSISGAYGYGSKFKFESSFKKWCFPSECLPYLFWRNSFPSCWTIYCVWQPILGNISIVKSEAFL